MNIKKNKENIRIQINSRKRNGTKQNDILRSIPRKLKEKEEEHERDQGHVKKNEKDKGEGTENMTENDT